MVWIGREVQTWFSLESYMQKYDVEFILRIKVEDQIFSRIFWKEELEGNLDFLN